MRTIELPLDFPKPMNEATGLAEYFGWLGHEAAGHIVDTGIPTFLRGSVLTATYLTEAERKQYENVTRQILYGQRTVPVTHDGPAADPDPLTPLSFSLEYKLGIPQSEFPKVMSKLRADLRVGQDGIITRVPCYLHQNASPALKRSHELLDPHNTLEFVEGEVPGNRGISYGGIIMKTDWVGAGSDHITPLVMHNCLFYNTGGKKDMRNPDNMTNMELWAHVRREGRQLMIDRPTPPKTIELPFPAYHRISARIDDPKDSESPWDFYQIGSRGLRIGSILGIRYSPMALTWLRELSNKASRHFTENPPSPSLIRNIRVNFRTARAFNKSETDRFLREVRLPEALQNF